MLCVCGLLQVELYQNPLHRMLVMSNDPDQLARMRSNRA